MEYGSIIALYDFYFKERHLFMHHFCGGEIFLALFHAALRKLPAQRVGKNDDNTACHVNSLSKHLGPCISRVSYYIVSHIYNAHMESSYILAIEIWVRSVLQNGNTTMSMATASEDQCSEISRLAGYRILKDNEAAEVFVMKGLSIHNIQQKSHDLLCVKGEKIFILDPTIWQFFEHASTILVGTASSIEQATDVITKKYGGFWSISEQLDLRNISEIDELYTTVRKSLGEL